MTTSREPVIGALFDLLKRAYAWKTTGRRLKLWSEVPAGSRPAMYLFEGGRHPYDWTQDVAARRSLKPQAFIYFDATEPTAIGSQTVNAIMDALDTALAPNAADKMRGSRNTLGGLVYNCRIEGEVFQDPGDIDGDGMIIVPFTILLP